MIKRKLVFALLCLTFLLMIPLVSFTQPSQEYLIGTLDVFVQHLLHAYNNEDYIMFYKYFARQMNPVKAKRFFEAEYSSLYKKELGPVLRTRLLRDKSSFDYDFPALVYEAQFEKFKPVVITVNFINQNDDYRITQMRFDRVYGDNLGGTHAP